MGLGDPVGLRPDEPAVVTASRSAAFCHIRGDHGIVH